MKRKLISILMLILAFSLFGQISLTLQESVEMAKENPHSASWGGMSKETWADPCSSSLGSPSI